MHALLAIVLAPKSAQVLHADQVVLMSCCRRVPLHERGLL